jgi:hypothetical protein
MKIERLPENYRKTEFGVAVGNVFEERCYQ